MHRTLAALAACLTFGCAKPDTPTPKVLLIGHAGVRVDILAAASTPIIDSLIAGGFFSDNAITRQRTVSGPGWSSFLIGVWPDKHGVTNNDFTGKRYDLYPDFLTRIETVRPELNTFAAIDWLPIGADSAEPADAAPHEPPDPAAGGSLVSPSDSVIRSTGMPRISDAIWARMV